MDDTFDISASTTQAEGRLQTLSVTVTFLQGKSSVYGVQRARVWGIQTKLHDIKKMMKKNEKKKNHTHIKGNFTTTKKTT